MGCGWSLLLLGVGCWLLLVVVWLSVLFMVGCSCDCLSVVLVFFFRVMVGLGCGWSLLMVVVGSCWLLVVVGRRWLSLVVLGFLFADGCSWLWLVVVGCRFGCCWLLFVVG